MVRTGITFASVASSASWAQRLSSCRSTSAAPRDSFISSSAAWRTPSMQCVTITLLCGLRCRRFRLRVEELGHGFSLVVSIHLAPDIHNRLKRFAGHAVTLHGLDELVIELKQQLVPERIDSGCPLAGAANHAADCASAHIALSLLHVWRHEAMHEALVLCDLARRSSLRPVRIDQRLYGIAIERL